MDVPKDAKVKKKGSFLGGLMKKGSKAKDAKDISLKYKGKLKDNEGSIEDIDVKANLEGGKYCNSSAKLTLLLSMRLLDFGIVLQHGLILLPKSL